MMSQITLSGSTDPHAGMPSGAPCEITLNICAGLSPNLKKLLLSAGPIPPPPFAAWQPTQLKLLKYFIPRCAALASFATGFSMSGTLTPPGVMFTSGTVSIFGADGVASLIALAAFGFCPRFCAPGVPGCTALGGGLLSCAAARDRKSVV